MNDVAVIIPTMWKYKPFNDFLPDLIECNYVNEVRLINNAPEDAPKDLIERINANHFYRFKTEIYESEDKTNMGVNPAWNLGVERSRSSIICLLNDDVIFDLRVFRKVIEFFDANPNAGVVGLNPGIPEFNQRPNESGEITFEEWKDGMHTYGYGCFMFLQRKHYYTIPSGLRLYYGDNWLFDTQLIKGRKNYVINDIVHFTPFAETTKTIPEAQSILEIEHFSFYQAMRDFVT